MLFFAALVAHMLPRHQPRPAPWPRGPPRAPRPLPPGGPGGLQALVLQMLEEPLGLALALLGLQVQMQVEVQVEVLEGLATEELLGLEVQRGSTAKPFQWSRLHPGFSSMQAPGKNHLRAMCWSQLEGQSLLGIDFIAKAVGARLRRFCLQVADESLDFEVLVVCLREEVGRG